MNSNSKSEGRVDTMLEKALTQRLKMQDVSHRKSIKLVDINGNRKKSTLTKQSIAEVDDVLWFSYGMELLRVDLRKHQRQQSIIADNTIENARRFWASTQSRRMFKRLMCLAAGDQQPRTVADIASELYVTHKAATQLVKDAEFNAVITKVVIDTPSGVSKARERNGYMATDEWLESFLQNGLRFSFEWADELMRARELFNEWHRYRITRES